MAVRVPVSSTVHEALRSEILRGALAPGDAVESERALSERFAVNRQAVREAVKRLQQAGLVAVSHGGATRVREWRSTAGLEVLVDMAGADGGLDLAGIRAVLEMRACIGSDAARRCAQRSPQLAPMLADAAAALAGAPTDAERKHAYARLWSLIVDGADNLAYRLALNSLVAGLDALDDEAALVGGEWRARAAHDALVEAIARSDDVAAQAAARALLERSIPWSS